MKKFLVLYTTTENGKEKIKSIYIFCEGLLDAIKEAHRRGNVIAVIDAKYEDFIS